MKEKKTPLRMCLGCREMKPKKEMLRVVRTSDTEEYIYDSTGKMNGRGAYVCKDNECINKCIKSKLFHKSFRANVPEDVYTAVKENLDIE